MDSPRDPDLGALRREIDDLDAQIVALINRRGDAARRVGLLKAQSGSPVYAPDREQQVLQRIRSLNTGPFPTETLVAIYRELMSGSLAVERSPRIAFLGPKGSYSHLAAQSKFGASVEYEPVTGITAAFAEVERGHADYAVVPIENTLSGAIAETLDAFLNSSACICAEHYQPIHHNLLARGPLSEVQRVYSKPEVFEQCRRWLLETGLYSRTVAVSSTSRAAELAAIEEGAAALASTLSAELYGVPIQVARVEDDPTNTTRFFVLGRSTPRPTGRDRSSLLFATPHRPGALAEVLDLFRKAQVNLSMLTSRPRRRPGWDYWFFADADGHADEESLRAVCAAGRELCPEWRVLGSYPRGDAE
jgi:chorismate mutase/prephenate dehydratase